MSCVTDGLTPGRAGNPCPDGRWLSVSLFSLSERTDRIIRLVGGVHSATRPKGAKKGSEEDWRPVRAKARTRAKARARASKEVCALKLGEQASKSALREDTSH